MTEQEQQAINEAAKEYSGISDDKFANSAKTYDAYDIYESFTKGAEVLDGMRKSSEEFPPKPKGATYAAIKSGRVNIPPSLLPLYNKIITIPDENLKITTKNWLISAMIDGYKVGKGELSENSGQTKELLEAAKYFRDAWNYEYSKITAKTEDVIKHNNVIANAENQSK